MDQQIKPHIAPDDFWVRCVNAQCVVIPVKVYAKYNEKGNLSEADFIGVRFAALPFSHGATGPEYWFMIDEGQSGEKGLYGTPNEALCAYEKQSGVTHGEVKP